MPWIPLSPAKATFHWLWIGQLVSNLGTQSSLYGIGLWLFQQGGRVGDFALVALVVQLARILALPLLSRGLACWPRRRVMVIANGLGAICTLLLASQLLGASHPPALAGVLGLQGLAAMAEACLVVSFSSLIPLLFAGGPPLARANGLFAGGDSLAASLAPFLGSWLAGLAGLQGVLALDASSFVIALACVLIAPWPQAVLQPRRASSPTGLGLHQALAQPIQRWWALIRVSSGMAMAYAITEILYPAWVSLQFGAQRMGIVLAVGLLGYGTGIAIWQQLSERWRRKSLRLALLMQGLVLLGIAPAVVATAPWLWLSGQALFSTSLPVGLAAVQTRWCETAPPGDLAPVMAVRYGCDWVARLIAFAFCSVAVDQWIKPAVQTLQRIEWLQTVIANSEATPIALSLAGSGALLLLCLGPSRSLQASCKAA